MSSKYSYVHITYVNHETGRFYARFAKHNSVIPYNINSLEHHTRKRLAEGNVYRFERMSPKTNWLLVIYMGDDKNYERKSVI